MLTPVVDLHHKDWDLGAPDDLFTSYRATGWQEYWKRAWCRVESFLAAVVPAKRQRSASGAVVEWCQCALVSCGDLIWPHGGTKER